MDSEVFKPQNAYMQDTLRKCWFALFLFILLVYAPIWFGAYQFDDFNVIVFFEPIHSLAGWWNNLGHGLRPLLKLSYCLNWILPAREMRLFGFHLVNLCVHLVNAWLIYAVVLGLPREKGGNQRPIALLVSAVFALHPANTEAVTYICGRSTSLMMMFAMISWLVWQMAQSRDVKSGWLAASLLAYVLAIATKEIAVLLPIGMWLAEWILGSKMATIDIFKRLRLHLSVMLITTLLFLLLPAYWHLIYGVALKMNLPDNFFAQFRGFSYLLWQWCWPVQMNIDPDLQRIPEWKIALTFSLSVIAVFLGLRRRTPQLSFACAWLFLWLFPVYVFLPRLDVVNDRQLYVAGWPLFLPVAGWLVERLQNLKWISACLIFGLAVLGGLTFVRNLDYSSEVRLWQSTVSASPYKSRVHNNLAYAYAQAGYNKLALQHYKRAIALKPDNWLAINNLQRLQELKSSTSRSSD